MLSYNIHVCCILLVIFHNYFRQQYTHVEAIPLLRTWKFYDEMSLKVFRKK